MIALNYNILKDYDTIAMTNGDGNYPITSIFSTYLTIKAQTTAGVTVITITFTADQTADCFFLAYSNLANNSPIVCRYYNAGAVLLYTDNLVKNNWYIVKSYFTKLTTIRSITITINDLGAAIFYIGTIWIGEKTSFPNFSSKPILNYGDLLPCQKSHSGQVAGQVKGLLDGWEINFGHIQSDAQILIMKAYVNVIGQLPHFIDFFENLDDQCYYCQLLISKMQWVRWGDWNFKHRDLKFIIEECL